MPWDLLSLLGILLVLLLVLGACWLFTRWAGTGLAGQFGAVGGARQIKVLERVPVGKDQALLVVQLGTRYFLLGSSPSGFSLLCELTEEEGALWAAPPPGAAAGGMAVNFRDMMQKFREKK